MSQVILIWLAVLLAVPLIADRKGRTAPSGLARFWARGWWGIYALFLPPIALVHVLMLKPNRSALDVRAAKAGTGPVCPACRLSVPSCASICGHCLTPISPIG